MADWLARPALPCQEDAPLGVEMFRFLLAPFQKSNAAKAAAPAQGDPARLEFERLFRDELVAHSQSIAQTRDARRGADPVHA